jgi:hypothetical protein
VTVAAFLLGAITGGASLGAVLGLLGSLIGGSSAHIRLVAFALAAFVALAIDVGPWRVPGPNRQVNERWLDEFRGWVYGAGFGAQLGLGVTTIVSSAVTYLALFAALLVADPVRGAVVMGCFGLVRGLTPLATARVRSPGQLIAFHRMFSALQAPGTVAVRSLTALAITAAAVGGLA